MDRYLSVVEAGEYAGVSCASIRRWCNSGKLPTKRTVGHHRRIKMSDLECILNTKQHTEREPSQDYVDYMGENTPTQTNPPALKDLHKFLKQVCKLDDPKQFAPTLETMNKKNLGSATFTARP